MKLKLKNYSVLLTLTATACILTLGISAAPKTANFSQINETSYTSKNYDPSEGFIAETHLTKTTHSEEGDFVTKKIFETKVLNTFAPTGDIDFADIVNQYN